MDTSPWRRPHVSEAADSLEGTRCLLLIQSNYQWVVLSEVGASGRAGGAELLRGGSVCFIRHEPSSFAFTVRAEPRRANLADIRRIWGAVAAERARGDVPSLVVRASPWEAGPCA